VLHDPVVAVGVVDVMPVRPVAIVEPDPPIYLYAECIAVPVYCGERLVVTEPVAVVVVVVVERGLVHPVTE
jgi:hypothetical protein